MAQTYRAFFDGTRASPLQDGLACIYFGTDDEDATGTILINNVEIIPRGGSLVTGSFSTLHVEGISGLTGGRDVTAIKLDTSSATLPAQVLLRVNADQHIEARIIGENRRLAANLTSENSANLALRGWLSVGWGGKNTGDQYNNRKNNADLEGLVIREGEGFSVCQVSQLRPAAFDIEIAFRDMATGAQYLIRTMQAYSPQATGDHALLSVFNGSGSGAVYEVTRCTVCDLPGVPNIIARVRYGIIEGFRSFDAESLTRTRPIVALDTANAAPSNTEALAGPFLPVYLGESSGAVADWYNGEALGNGSGASRTMNMNLGCLRQLQWPQRVVEISTARSPVRTNVWDPHSQDSCAITLRRGQGFAVMAGAQSTPERNAQDGGSCCLNVAIDFTYVPGTSGCPVYPTLAAVTAIIPTIILPGSAPTPSDPPTAEDYAWAALNGVIA